MTIPSTGRKTLLFNVIFLLLIGGIFLFLWSAPPETTVKLPSDKIHSGFYYLPREEAESLCGKCHNPEGEAPLSKKHPPKHQCLLCHKKK